MTTDNTVGEQIVERLEEFVEELERERFEAWSIERFAGGARLSKRTNGEYEDGTTGLLWRTWQAALTFRQKATQ